MEQGEDMRPEAEAAVPHEGEPAADVAELEARARRADELLSQLQRLKADFDNYRKRMLQEQARWQEAALAGFVTDLLPVVDNLERAVASGGDLAAVRQGVELTLRQLNELLGKAGIEPLQAVGQPFDPTLHEAMLQVESAEHDDGQVIEELRKGYQMKRQVLRPSLVKVARRPAAGAEAQRQGEGREGAQSD